MVQGWFRVGSGLVQGWFRVGSGLVILRASAKHERAFVTAMKARSCFALARDMNDYFN